LPHYLKCILNARAMQSQGALIVAHKFNQLNGLVELNNDLMLGELLRFRAEGL